MKFSLILAAGLVAASSADAATCGKLSYDGDSVNTLTFADYSCTSDAEGRLFVGGNLKVSSYSAGDKLTSRGEDIVVVGGKADFSNGRVYHGDMVISSAANDLVAAPVKHGLTNDGYNLKIDPDRFNFAGAKAHYLKLSADLAAKPVTGQVDWKTWETAFVGSGAKEEVFLIDCAKMNGLGSSRQFKSMSNADTIIINVKGTSSCNFVSGGFYWNGSGSMRGAAPKIIYNFYQTSALTVQNLSVEGSILAPKARLSGAAGVIWGQTIVDSYDTMVQQNHLPFTGCLPATGPDPTPDPTPVPTTADPTPDPTPVPTTADPTPDPTPVPTTADPTPDPTPVPTAKPFTNSAGTCAVSVHGDDVYKCSDAQCYKSTKADRSSWSFVESAHASAVAAGAQFVTSDATWTASAFGAVSVDTAAGATYGFPCECACQAN